MNKLISILVVFISLSFPVAHAENIQKNPQSIKSNNVLVSQLSPPQGSQTSPLLGLLGLAVVLGIAGFSIKKSTH